MRQLRRAPDRLPPPPRYVGAEVELRASTARPAGEMRRPMALLRRIYGWFRPRRAAGLDELAAALRRCRVELDAHRAGWPRGAR